jgi:hypothetical protein
MDTSRLLVEWLFILTVGGIAWFLTGRERANTPAQPKPFWPTSTKQWLAVIGFLIFTSGSAVLTVVSLPERPKQAHHIDFVADKVVEAPVPAGFIEVEVTGYGKFEFPDIMTQDEIQAVLKRKFWKPAHSTNVPDASDKFLDQK